MGKEAKGESAGGGEEGEVMAESKRIEQFLVYGSKGHVKTTVHLWDDEEVELYHNCGECLNMTSVVLTIEDLEEIVGRANKALRERGGKGDGE